MGLGCVWVSGRCSGLVWGGFRLVSRVDFKVGFAALGLGLGLVWGWFRVGSDAVWAGRVGLVGYQRVWVFGVRLGWV